MGILRGLELEGPAREALAVALWPAVVGDRIAAATRAARIQGGTLEVETRSSAWSQELTFLKATLVKRLNAQVGAEVVRDLRFRVAPIVAARTAVAPAHAPEPGELEAIAVPHDVRRRIEQKAAHSDPDLAALCRRVLTREWRLEEWRRHRGFRPCARCGALCEPPTELCPVCAVDKD